MSQMASNSKVTRKRSFSSSTTSFNTISGNAFLSTTSINLVEDSSSSSSSSSSTRRTTLATNNNDNAKWKKKRLQPQKEQKQVGFYTITTTHHHQIVTDQAHTTTTTTDITNIPHKKFSQRSVPAFLHKLFKFYKHNTFASFVRQLNMYDFHKIPHLQQDVLITATNMENEVWEFSNPHFQRSRPDLLVLVTRKRNRDRDDAAAADTGRVNLGSLVKEITVIRKNQTNITVDLRNIHRDNEINWRETLAAREKHQKHQQVISKILQFLSAVFSNEHHQLSGILVNDQQEQHQQEESQQRTQTQDAPEQQPSFYYQQNQQQNDHYFLSKPITPAATAATSTANDGSSDDVDEDCDEINNPTDGVNANNMTINALHKVVPPHTNIDEKLATAKQNGKMKDTLDKYRTTAQHATSSAFNSADYDADGNRSYRSAQAITNDIDELQENVETLAAQLGIDPMQFLEKINNFGEFTDSYSLMISSASKNDKLRLFKLAGDSQTASVSPQMIQHSNQFAMSSDTKPIIQQQEQPFLDQNNFVSTGATAINTTTTTNSADPSNPLTFFFRQLLKSVDSYHIDPPFSCARGTAAHVNNNHNKQLDTIYQSNPIPCVTSNNNNDSNLSPLAAATNPTADTNIYASFFKNNKNNHIDMFTTTTETTNNKSEEEQDHLFRSSVLNHQQMQDQRFHHLQLHHNRHQASRSSTTTTTSNKFLNTPMIHLPQQGYYPNATIANKSNFSSQFEPIVHQQTIFTPNIVPAQHSFHALHLELTGNNNNMNSNSPQ